MNAISQQDLNDVSKMQVLIDQLFEQTVSLAQESLKWKTIHVNGDVTTRKKGEYLQRSSIHDQVTYDQLRSVLFIDHSLNEVNYVESMTEAILLEKVNEEANVFWLAFKTPALSSNREFVELVATREAGRSFMVVSQPVDRKGPEGKGHYVRGAYEAWEIVTEKPNGQVEWICIQRSSAGGLIPAAVSNWVAGKDFYHDVESIIKYIHDHNL